MRYTLLKNEPTSMHQPSATDHKVTINVDTARVRTVRRRLLAWFRSDRRDFFWRESATSPFGVLISEILLCRSRAESVELVVRRLLARFPSPAALTRASPRSVERILYPLGLHRTRARLIVRCARHLVEQHGGQVPKDLRALMSLPYVGRYAASSVACVSFGRRLPVLDANVARVYQRLFSLPPLAVRVTDAKHLWALAGAMLPRKGVREYNWAILDLGGTICKPRNPGCGRCPLAAACDESRDRSCGTR
jgi:A/G-specific adenine glycosylase